MRSLRPLIALCLAMVVASACTTSSTPTQTAAAPESQPAPSTQETQAMNTPEFERLNQTFATRYASKNIEGALEHYHPETTWYLTNGAHKSSRGEVQGALEALQESGAGAFSFSEHVHHALKQGHVTTDAFVFEHAPQRRVSGTRYAFWSEDGQIIDDLWVPQTPAEDATRAEVDAYFDTLSRAYTSADASALGALYTDDATLVLSDGKRFEGRATHDMLSQVANMGVETMSITTREVHPASNTHLYTLSSQRFSLPGPDGPITLDAHTLRLLERTEQGSWQTRVELAWPAL